MPTFLSDDEYRTLNAACARLIPAQGAHPGGAALGCADYIDGLLGAFAVTPPRIWAGGPFSGRAGGEAGFGRFLELSRVEELAWRTRIEGSRGIADREWNGPVRGWQEVYREGIAALGDAFLDLDAAEQEAALSAAPEFADLLFEHACEACYGPPEYGGNRDLGGWRQFDYPGDVVPRGWTDDEVSNA